MWKPRIKKWPEHTNTMEGCINTESQQQDMPPYEQNSTKLQTVKNIRKHRVGKT